MQVAGNGMGMAWQAWQAGTGAGKVWQGWVRENGNGGSKVKVKRGKVLCKGAGKKQAAVIWESGGGGGNGNTHVGTRIIGKNVRMVAGRVGWWWWG